MNEIDKIKVKQEKNNVTENKREKRNYSKHIKTCMYRNFKMRDKKVNGKNKGSHFLIPEFLCPLNPGGEGL